MTQTSIPLRVLLDDHPVAVRTTLTRISSWMLGLASTLPTPGDPDGAPVELHSSYVGHPLLRTHATHLLLGAEGQPHAVLQHQHPDAGQVEDCLILFRPRELIYDHAHRLLEHLQQLGYAARLEIPDDAFKALDHRARPGRA